MSAMKKTSVKSPEQPVDILQDLPQLQSKATSVTHHRKRFMQKIQVLRIKLWRKQQFTKPRNKAVIDSLVVQLKQYLPVETVSFTERQIILHHSKMFQCRYVIKDEMLALSIFYQSRKAHKLLSKLFTLPSKRTLKTAYKTFA